MTEGLAPHWFVTVNNSTSYVVQAGAPEIAVIRACAQWQEDRSVTRQDRATGVSALHVRLAKFTEIRSRVTKR
jgi:hypothetical protein